MHINVKNLIFYHSCEKLSVSKIYDGFNCYLKFTCYNFDKVKKLFTLFCLHYWVFEISTSNERKKEQNFVKYQNILVQHVQSN
jgi:hypothetical protein